MKNEPFGIRTAGFSQKTESLTTSEESRGKQPVGTNRGCFEVYYDGVSIPCENWNETLCFSDKDGRTAVHAAAESGNELEVAFLREACGRDLLLEKDMHGTSPVHRAALSNSVAVLRMLYASNGIDALEARDKDNRTAMHMAAGAGNVESLQWLYEVGGEDMLRSRDQEGRTPEHYAANAGYIQVLQRMWKISVWNRVILLGLVPPFRAYPLKRSGHGECSFLVCYPFSGDKKGMSVAHYIGAGDLLSEMFDGGRPCASASNSPTHQVAILRYILEVGGKGALTTQDEEGRSLAHMAASRDRVDVLDYLNDVIGRHILSVVDKNGK